MYLPVIADDDGPDMNDVRTDLVLWQSLWQVVVASEQLPASAGGLQQGLYPHIHVLFQIFASLPISTVIPERTFSSMKSLKTYLCSVDRERYAMVSKGVGQ